MAAIVGLVTVIFFEQLEHAPKPRDVFMLALGIPTMFIGTVSNLNSRFDATRTTDRASLAIEQEGEIGPPPSGLEILGSGADSSATWVPWLVDEAFAQARGTPSTRVTGSGYLVVIGTFREPSVASAKLRQMQKQAFRTERYAQKALSLYRAGDGTYYLTYARVATPSEAQRIYRLLLINDPQVAPRIIQLHS
jgi:hypothetical protein